MRAMGRYSFVGARDRDELALPSQRLIEAALSVDVEGVTQSLRSKTVDVNYIGTVSLRVKCFESVVREEEPDDTEVVYRDFVTDVSPLFAAAHSGHSDIVRKLLVHNELCLIWCIDRVLYYFLLLVDFLFYSSWLLYLFCVNFV